MHSLNDQCFIFFSELNSFNKIKIKIVCLDIDIFLLSYAVDTSLYHINAKNSL